MDKFLDFLPVICLWAGVLVFFLLNRIKVFYFLWGSIGFTLIAVLLLQGSVVEAALSDMAIDFITYLNKHLAIPVLPFAGAGTILMTGTKISGYTSLEIGTECSGLLEIVVFYGLTLFYPVLSFMHRVVFLIAGSIIIYFINIFRVQMIITAIYFGGRDTIFLAHTILGRGLFFIMMLTLYWFFFTRSTMVFLNNKLEPKGEE